MPRVFDSTGRFLGELPATSPGTGDVASVGTDVTADDPNAPMQELTVTGHATWWPVWMAGGFVLGLLASKWVRR